ncbi:collagen alpha-1(I) chain-like [Anas acuta]|uniref:collagen alpha-1(I) chain-like n=1 Tax=Anas acuta TaxID=28680 RepID=UPI0035C8E165
MSPSLPHPDGAGHRGPHVRAWTWAAGAAQPQPHSTSRMGSCCRSPLAAQGAGTGSLPGLPDAPQACVGWPRRGGSVSVVLLRSLLSLCSTRACLGHAAIPEDRLSFPSALPATHEPARTAVRRGLVVSGSRGRGEITPAPPQRGSWGSWGWSRGAKWLQVQQGQKAPSSPKGENRRRDPEGKPGAAGGDRGGARGALPKPCPVLRGGFGFFRLGIKKGVGGAGGPLGPAGRSAEKAPTAGQERAEAGAEPAVEARGARPGPARPGRGGGTAGPLPGPPLRPGPGPCPPRAGGVPRPGSCTGPAGGGPGAATTPGRGRRGPGAPRRPPLPPGPPGARCPRRRPPGTAGVKRRSPARAVSPLSR